MRRPTIQQRDKLFISGKWVTPQDRDVIEVIHSTTGAVVGTTPEGSAVDAEAAVAAVCAASGDWAATLAARRAEYVQKIADGLRAHSEKLAQLIAGEIGMPIKLVRAIQVGGPAYNWNNLAKLLSMLEFGEHVGNLLVVRGLVDVVDAITPWNCPLNQITLKAVPTLAAGCTVILKSLEVAPLSTFVLAEVIEEAGLPPGVFNLVTSYDPVVGEVLISDLEVDMVSFTDSTHAGKRMVRLASQSVKQVALELGGKSALVTLDDIDLASAVKGTLSARFLSPGQTCSAHTYMLVPRAEYEEVKVLAAQLAAAYMPGDPAQESTHPGPPISAMQCDRVLGYIRKGLEEGAELTTGNADAPEGLTTSYFIRPAVLGNVKTTDTVARGETSGPVLTVICYDDEEEAVRITNDSIYGLGGGVWLGDEARAIRVTWRIRTGRVNINGGSFSVQTPSSGYKQSGNERENGKYDLEEFLEYKALQLNPAKTT